MFAGRSAVCSQANKREDHSRFSKSRIRFILFKQTKSQHSLFFLPSFQSHAPILIQSNGGCKETSIARSQNALLGNKISEMCVSLPASDTFFPTITKPIKAWMVSSEMLPPVHFDMTSEVPLDFNKYLYVVPAV